MQINTEQMAIISKSKAFIASLLFAFVITAFTCEANAWTRGKPVGKAQLNVGGADLIPANFINVLKTAYPLLGSPADIGNLDSDNYLISTPSANFGLAFPVSGTMWTNTQYKLAWPATIQFKVILNFSATACSAVNATLSGCNTITTVPGLAGSVTFTTTTNQFSMFFPTGATYSRSGGELALYRVSDEAAYLAGEIFTPEYVALIRNANPATIRPMGWVQIGAANYNGETQWRYRTQKTNMTWNTGGRWQPGAYGGAISGTDTYTAAAAPDTPVTWTDGELYIGIIANANTSTTPTINIGSRGSKTIVTNAIAALGIGAMAANSVGVFVYDSILDKVIFQSTALTTGIPYEAHIELANKVNANLWTTVPPMANDDYVTNQATLIKGSLNASLYSYWEWSNEVWNFGFPQTQYANARGCAMGFTTSSNRCIYGYYGIRVKQIMGALVPAVWAGRLGSLRRIVAYQGAGDITNVTYRFNGTDLAPSGVGTGQGNATYNSFTGSANWTTFPNRPIDIVEVLSYAGYASGQNMCDCTPTAANAPFYQALVTAWESGDSATAVSMIDADIRTARTLVQNVTASGTTFTTPSPHGFVVGGSPSRVAFQVTGGTAYSGVTVNNLYRVTSVPTTTTFTMQAFIGGQPSGANINAGTAGSGTMTVGTAPNANFININNTYYSFGESNAALYDAARTGVGQPLLRVEQYEGAIDINGLTSAQCITLGIVGSDCAGSILAAAEAWRFDLKAKATFLTYYNQFKGLDSSMPSTFGLMAHSVAQSQLILPGINPAANFWSLMSGPLPTSTPYQLYYGFQTYNLNFLFERDLDPASDNNSPAFLNKVA